MNIPRFLQLYKEDRVEDAFLSVILDNPLPASTGRVCQHPCDDRCRRAALDEPVNTRDVHRRIADEVLLSAAFEEGKVEKQYLALVRGTPPPAGVIDYAIQKKEDGPRVPAVTRFRVVGRSPVDRCSLVLALPETGRLHQIRRHLRHIDHPLVGDVKHGSGQINRHYRTTYNLHRLALHASRLAFDHPVTKERIEIACNLPSDLTLPFEALGLKTDVDLS